MNTQAVDARKPYFLITIDTEGDNLWASPRVVTTKNAQFLPRFQALCERFEFKPTYLTNYEMAKDEAFQEFGREIIRRDTGEIGMHLHAWDSPPIVALTSDDMYYHPYLIEYPLPVMQEKIHYMTTLLEDTYETSIVSHRAGRWAFNDVYARLLVQAGYRVDCSVTPHVSWRATKGDPQQHGGSDYRGFPDDAYFMDLQHIHKPETSPLLEVPMTIVRHPSKLRHAAKPLEQASRFASRVIRHFIPEVLWLRPTGSNLSHMLLVIQHATREHRRYVEFMLHSSELMPGGSPTFPSEDAIERLYVDLEHLFSVAAKHFGGATLRQFYDAYAPHAY